MFSINTKLSSVLCATKPFQQNSIDKKEKKAVINRIADLLKDKYIFPDRGKICGKQIKSNLKSGDYDDIMNALKFAEVLTKDIQKSSKDKHMRVRLIEVGHLSEDTKSPLREPLRLYRLMQNEHYGFHKIGWFEGNIGYFDFRRFTSTSVVKDLFLGVIHQLSSTNAIIIDLRENEGGSPDMVQLLSSYFFKHPTQLNSFYFRLENFMQEWWTMQKVEGKRLVDVPLFLLTSKKTFSAAESFAYDMKVHNRATIIGDTTRGGAHTVSLFKINDRFEIFISTGRAVNPVTGSNWEGVGVVPDVAVPAETALDTALIFAMKAAKDYSETKELVLKKTIQKIERQLKDVEMLVKNNKEREAATVLDSVFQEGLEINLMSDFLVGILALQYRGNQNMQIVILKKNIEYHPNLYSAHEKLALTYFFQGNKQLARKHFQKVLELYPNHSNSLKMLEKL